MQVTNENVLTQEKDFELQNSWIILLLKEICSRLSEFKEYRYRYQFNSTFEYLLYVKPYARFYEEFKNESVVIM